MDTYEKKYKEALEKAKKELQTCGSKDCDAARQIYRFFPELKESEDERIRKWLIGTIKQIPDSSIEWETISKSDVLAWLEKQVPVDEDEIVKGIRRGVAISLMNHIDANSKGMCLSNMECEDIENAIVNEDWDKVYGYMKKKLEKQGEQKSIWHNEDEEPQRDSLILLIMQSGTPIVAKVVEPNHTFNHGERWAYIDDLLEKQGE